MISDQGRFKSLLQKESSILEDLYAVLLQEFSALKERNSEAITLLAKEKDSLLNKLEKLDQERQLFLESNDQASIPNNSDEINHLKSEIERCLDKCKKQNNINGGIIEVSKLFNEKMIDIISGNTTKENTYGATGKNNSDRNQHSLGRV